LLKPLVYAWIQWLIYLVQRLLLVDVQTLVEERRKIVALKGLKILKTLKRRLGLHGLEHLVASDLDMRDCKQWIEGRIIALDLGVVGIHEVLDYLECTVIQLVSLPWEDFTNFCK